MKLTERNKTTTFNFKMQSTSKTIVQAFLKNELLVHFMSPFFAKKMLQMFCFAIFVVPIECWEFLQNIHKRRTDFWRVVNNILHIYSIVKFLDGT